jgi:hypothetical protein
MKTRMMIGLSAAVCTVVISGCYTQLMTPQEFIQVKRGMTARSAPDQTYALNYNQSCVSCHTVSELNERAEEMEYYGIRSVHDGYLLSSRDWNKAYPVGITVDGPAGPILWPPPAAPSMPWWTPTIVSSPTAPAQSTAPQERRRSGGAVSIPGDGKRKEEESAPVYSAPAPKVNSEKVTPPSSTPSVNSTPAPAPSQDSGNEGRRKRIPD